MSAPTIERTTITEPGVYDMTDEVYHGDPVPGGSLSSSGARKLLPPSCPAKYKHELEHGRAPKAAWDIGHAAHKLVLGTGPELVVIDAGDWKTKAAREARDEAYAAGAVPLLPDHYATVEAMAAALRQHPIAAALLNPDHGAAEQSMFWPDRVGIWRRARLDWLPDNVSNAGRLLVPDYKTSISADDEDFRRTANNYGYHQQASWYLDAVKALGLAEEAAFLFIVQEKTAPYLVNVIELDWMALQIGNHLNRQAIGIFRECQELGDWPGYHPSVHLVSLPDYIERKYAEELPR